MARKPASVSKQMIFTGLVSSVVILDQVTKWLVVGRFRVGESVSVISGFFNLTYITNTGAAFGLLAHANPIFRVPFFVVVPMAMLVVIAYIFRKIPANDVKLSIALSLVIGGAVGNLIDRVSLGHVVDFLDFHWNYAHHFPAFNVADSAICVGVGIFFLDLVNKDAKIVRGAAKRSS